MLGTLVAICRLWYPYSNYAVVSYPAYRDILNSDIIINIFNNSSQNVLTAVRSCSTLFCHSVQLPRCCIFVKVLLPDIIHSSLHRLHIAIFQNTADTAYCDHSGTQLNG
jgi:hypothetical protein